MGVPRVGLAVFVIKGDKVLMSLRLKSLGENTWQLPGGHLEFFESFEDCARREVLEESGVVISDVEFVAVTNDLFVEENKHYVTIFLRARYVSGTPQVLEPGKCLSWDWFSWDELPSPLFLPLESFVMFGLSPFE